MLTGRATRRSDVTGNDNDCDPNRVGNSEAAREDEEQCAKKLKQKMKTKTHIESKWGTAAAAAAVTLLQF